MMVLRQDQNVMEEEFCLKCLSAVCSHPVNAEYREKHAKWFQTIEKIHLVSIW